MGPSRATTWCQFLVGEVQGQGAEWGLVGNDSRSQSGWVSVSSSRWTLSPGCPNLSLARFKGLKLRKRSVFRCHWQQIQNPLVSVTLGKALAACVHHCGRGEDPHGKCVDWEGTGLQASSVHVLLNKHQALPCSQVSSFALPT